MKTSVLYALTSARFGLAGLLLGLASLVAAMTVSAQSNLEPLGKMHIPIGKPNTVDALKTFVEAEGNYSPGVGSFGVYFWIWDDATHKLWAPTMSEAAPDVAVVNYNVFNRDGMYIANIFQKSGVQKPTDWRYFPLARAHQGLLAGNRNAGWETLQVHLDHPQMRGWFAFDEGGRSGIGNWNHLRSRLAIKPFDGNVLGTMAMPHGWAIAEFYLLLRAVTP